MKEREGYNNNEWSTQYFTFLHERMGECDCIVIGESGMHARAKITLKISVGVVGEGMEKREEHSWIVAESSSCHCTLTVLMRTMIFEHSYSAFSTLHAASRLCLRC
jgi:hypothetical protein